MHHLFLGLDPTPLGAAPFSLATDESVRTDAANLGLSIHPRGRVYVLPCVAGHVGADAAAAMLSEAPQRSDAIQLLVDVGTNAEIVLGNSERILAASSPTGPAFEGAQISSGQRAAPGAIERVRIDRETLEPRIKVVGGEHWSDEDDFYTEIEDTPVTGICGSGIIEAIAGLFLAGIVPGLLLGLALAATNHVMAIRHGVEVRSARPSPGPTPRSWSPRPTCGRCNWPRRLSSPGPGCSWIVTKPTPSTRSGSPVRSATTSIPSMR
jgi:uncharacterized 2Fe-2S/4Fe-4S cluster protein (DUF4445 family)